MHLSSAEINGMSRVIVVSFSYSGGIPVEYYLADIERIVTYYRNKSKPKISVEVYTDVDFESVFGFRKFIRDNARAGTVWYFLGHGEVKGFVLPNRMCLPWSTLGFDIDCHGQTCVFDCCYSGNALYYISRSAVVTSCRSYQKSIFINSTHGSLFTYCLFTKRLADLDSMARSANSDQQYTIRGNVSELVPIYARSNPFRRRRKVNHGINKC